MDPFAMGKGPFGGSAPASGRGDRPLAAKYWPDVPRGCYARGVAEKPAHGEATLLLASLRAGGSEAFARLHEILYAELRALADHHLRGERPDHTLQPTALVHEAWMRLAGHDPAAWQNRAHFLGVSSLAMRRVLVDHARAKQREKRGGHAARESIELDALASEAGVDPSLDLVALDEALVELAKADERAAKVVELRFFGGLTEEDTALALGVSRSTVTLAWRAARAWLGVRLEGGEGERG